MNQLATTEEAPSRPQCVILAGGRGSRLGHLTADLPKPLMPVAGQPFLDHLIDRCVRFGFSEVLVLAGYKAEALEAWERRRRRRRSPSSALGARPVLSGRRRRRFRFMVLNGADGHQLAGLFGWRWCPLWRGGVAGRTDHRLRGRQRPDELRHLCAPQIGTEMAGDFSLETEAWRRPGSFGAARDGAFVDIGVPKSLAWADAHVGAWGPQGLALVDGAAVAVALATDDAKSEALFARWPIDLDLSPSPPGRPPAGPGRRWRRRHGHAAAHLSTNAALADANALTHLGVDRRHVADRDTLTGCLRQTFSAPRRRPSRPLTGARRLRPCRARANELTLRRVGDTLRALRPGRGRCLINV